MGQLSSCVRTSVEVGVKPMTKSLVKSKRMEIENDPGTTEDCEGFVHDQVIIDPEITTMILAKLNFQSLKQVRLVCKSWLRVAVTHIEKKVRAVRFNRELSASRFPLFLEILAKKIPGLPQPFNAIDMDLTGRCHSVPFPELAQQLSSLCPPLALTRFTPWDMPLELALPLINQCSFNLEYLDFGAHTCEAESMLFLMDPKQQFPKLKHLYVSASKAGNNDYNLTRFPPIIAWIVNASPHLENYGLSNGVGLELTSRLLTEVDIKNVKTLKFGLFPTSRLFLELYLSIPFRQLEYLDLRFEGGRNNFETLWMLAQIVTQCANSLRKLVLNGLRFQENPRATFPICPHVQELSVGSLVYSSDFLLQHFPSLHVLGVGTVHVELDEGWSWSNLSPLSGVKTLRIRDIKDIRLKLYSMERQIPEQVRFFEKFPRLNRLTVPAFLLSHCCELKASDPLEFSNLLAEVKHLVVVDFDENYGAFTSDLVSGSDSWLAVLPGIETFSMTAFDLTLASMASKELQNLRIMKFPWGSTGRWNFRPDMKALLEVTRGVEKILITNCCSSPSSPSSRSRWSESLLKQFFESVPNAQCGCGTRDMPLE